MTFHTCFSAVPMGDQMIAKFIAPSRLRKPLEIFCFDLHRVAIAFGLVIGGGHSRIDGEAQNVLLARGEAQEEIVSGSTPLAAKAEARPASAAGCEMVADTYRHCLKLTSGHFAMIDNGLGLAAHGRERDQSWH
jgi:hypothetical protein